MSWGGVSTYWKKAKFRPEKIVGFLVFGHEPTEIKDCKSPIFGYKTHVRSSDMLVEMGIFDYMYSKCKNGDSCYPEEWPEMTL